jgi:hypothetical protein
MKKITVLVLMLFTALGYAQVGINTNTPDASSALEIESTAGGILIPRMTEIQRDAIVSPASGLMIYQTDEVSGFYFYNGTGWTKIDGVAGPQGPPGADGADGAQGPVGSTGAQGLAGPVGTQGPAGAQGPAGPVGAQGPIGPTGNQGAQGDTGIQGINGLTAYELWQDAGNIGTEAEFLASLVGPQGPAGPLTNNFYETYSFSSGGEEFNGSDLLTLGTLQINEAGFVGVYIKLDVRKERYTASNYVSLQIWNGSDQIQINSIDGVDLGVSDPNNPKSDSKLTSAHFYVEENTTLTIKGFYSVSGYNNYQNQGGNWGSFNVALYR